LPASPASSLARSAFDLERGRPWRAHARRAPPARLPLVAAVLALLAGVSRARPADGRDQPPRSTARDGAFEAEDREYQIKAAFLLNFIRYTTWPKESFEDDQSPIVLTVVGKDPFGKVLESTFEKEEAHGRRILVSRSKEVPETVGGHVVFGAELPRPARDELLQKCRKQPILLIGEQEDFALDGAQVNFYIQDQKVRFEINSDAAAEASLQISPAVLKLARIVRSRKEN
jgi:hypothetical protein